MSKLITLTNLEKFLEKIRGIFVAKEALGKFSTDYIGLDVTHNKKVKEADVIHIHWPHGGMLGITELNKLLKLKKPIVWTMHDMWAVTAGCFYTYGCRQFEAGCQKCPLFHNKNVSDYQKRKSLFFSNPYVHLVGCSSWITEEARKSKTLSEKANTPIHILNCLDTDVFHPYKKEDARKQLNLPNDRKIILFGASAANSDCRKGFDLLIDAIKRINPAEYLILVFGNSELIGLPEGFTIVGLGQINSENKLALIYSASDVFVAPSREENLANTVVEAQSCGLPVAAFNIGGMPDMIESGVNGYLAKPFDTGDLATAIILCCEMDEKIRNFVRNRAVEMYSFHASARNYIKLYNRIISEGPK